MHADNAIDETIFGPDPHPPAADPRADIWPGSSEIQSFVKARRKPSSTATAPENIQTPSDSAELAPSYASRAAFKLVQLDDIHKFLPRPTHKPPSSSKRQRIVVDLGAAPGGWTQVALQRCRPGAGTRIFALDILPVDPIFTHGATFLQGDFLDPNIQARLEDAIVNGHASDRQDPTPDTEPNEDCFDEDETDERHELLTGRGGSQGMVDVVLSDMMAPTTGNPIADTEASLQLCRSAFLFAARNLRRRPLSTSPSSTATAQQTPHRTFFVCKFFGSPAADDFRRRVLERCFASVKVEKGRVSASRKESREAFWVCRGFLGPQAVDLEALYA